MRKRLVRKTFDMIQDISESENKEVRITQIVYYQLFVLRLQLGGTPNCKQFEYNGSMVISFAHLVFYTVQELVLQ